jgi:16S rRNA (cytosine1402-N4)-methyltransferase
MNNYHTSVLLQEVLTFLAVKHAGLYIDCTLGGGGHTFEIISRGGKVLGFDVDDDAVSFVKEKLREKGLSEGKELTIVQANFNQLEKIAPKLGFESVDGILLDLGVSSHQFDEPIRGFSFKDGPLDMRMGRDLGVRAADLINGLTEKELVELFERFGEEPFARRIAKAIVDSRKVNPLLTTQQLADLIRSVVRGEQGIHPATRVFQALRIAVNDELNVLHEVLPQAIRLLKPQGRLVVISFHSLEDRIVKHTFDQYKKESTVTILTDKPVTATEEEVLQNRRARSAKLRAIEKI